MNDNKIRELLSYLTMANNVLIDLTPEETGMPKRVLGRLYCDFKELYGMVKLVYLFHQGEHIEQDHFDKEDKDALVQEK